MPSTELNLPTRPVPALDGLRAVAVAAVLLYHLQMLKGGYVGVQVFFVLSGFLIATLLLSECDRTGAIDYRGFYVRRAARLLPAAYVVIVVASLLSATLVWEARSQTLLAAICSLLYVSNWLSFGLNRFLGLLNFTWSLSQEEQFYFLAPAVLRRSRPGQRRRWAAIAVGAAVALMAVRGILVLALPNAAASTYHNPIVNLDAMLVGVGLALYFASPRTDPGTTRVRVFGLGAFVGVAALIAACVTCTLDGPGIAIAEPVAVTGSALVLIAVTVASSSIIPRVLQFPAMVWIGRRSYAMYLVQVPLVFAWRRILGLRGTTGVHWSQTVAVAASTIVLAAVSARYLETPIRQWAGHRFPDRGRLAGATDRVVSG